MYYDHIGYETTVLENILLNELFHMMLSLMCQNGPSLAISNQVSIFG